MTNSAPKLRQVVDDPLNATAHSFETSNGNLSDNSPMINNVLRDSNGYGYAFDPTICREIDDRILCGYEKNRGEKRDHIPVDLGSGCRSRGDRIECGYNRPYPQNSNGYDSLRAKPIMTNATSNTTSLPTKPEEIDDSIILVRSAVSEVPNQNIGLTNSSSTIPIISKPAPTVHEMITSQDSKTKNKTANPQLLSPSDIKIKSATTTKLSDITISPNKPSISTTMKLSTEASKTASYKKPEKNTPSPQIVHLKTNTTRRPTEIPTFNVHAAKMLKAMPISDPTINDDIVTTNYVKNSSHDLKINITENIIQKEVYSNDIKQSPKGLLDITNKKVLPSVDDPNIGKLLSASAEVIKNRIQIMRRNNDKTKTICVEQDDRIVCYDYKKI